MNLKHITAVQQCKDVGSHSTCLHSENFKMNRMAIPFYVRMYVICFFSHEFLGWIHISKPADIYFVSGAYWAASACNIFIPKNVKIK